MKKRLSFVMTQKEYEDLNVAEIAKLFRDLLMRERKQNNSSLNFSNPLLTFGSQFTSNGLTRQEFLQLSIIARNLLNDVEADEIEKQKVETFLKKCEDLMK